MKIKRMIAILVMAILVSCNGGSTVTVTSDSTKVDSLKIKADTVK